MTTPQGWQHLYDQEVAIMNAGADLYNRGQIDYVYCDGVERYRAPSITPDRTS